MKFIIFKYLTTALMVVIISEVAKRSDKLGALIASLPLVTIMVMIWLKVETNDSVKIANHAYYTFWYVIPTLPMFLLIPLLIKNGWGVFQSIAAGSVLTAGLFLATALIGKKFGIELI